jgi:hypothetical protein
MVGGALALLHPPGAIFPNDEGAVHDSSNLFKRLV